MENIDGRIVCYLEARQLGVKRVALMPGSRQQAFFEDSNVRSRPPSSETLD
jgi:hypothetical protein